MYSSQTRNYFSTEELLANVVRELMPTNKNIITSNIRDVLLIFGNTMVTGGNYLLYQDGVLTLVPALCFMLEGAVNSKISITNLILRYRNINNPTINNLLTGLSLATSPLLPLAVVWLNWPTPNPETLPVTYAFITSATASSLNHMITMKKKISECYTTTNADNTIRQQRSIWQKIGNTAVSLLAPITVASAIAGVSLFAYHELSNPSNNDDEQPFYKKKSVAFSEVIAGLSLVGTGLLINTCRELYENWCTNDNDFDPININKDSPTSGRLSISENNFFTQGLLNEYLDSEKINSEDNPQSAIPDFTVVEIHNPKLMKTESSLSLNIEDNLPVRKLSLERQSF